MGTTQSSRFAADYQSCCLQSLCLFREPTYFPSAFGYRLLLCGQMSSLAPVEPQGLNINFPLIPKADSRHQRTLQCLLSGQSVRRELLANCRPSGSPHSRHLSGRCTPKPVRRPIHTTRPYVELHIRPTTCRSSVITNCSSTQSPSIEPLVQRTEAEGTWVISGK